MNKLKLDLDTLNVDKFQVEPEGQEEKGTVLALSDTLTYTTYPIRYCPNMPATARC